MYVASSTYNRKQRHNKKSASRPLFSAQKINKRNGAVTKFLVHLIYFHHRKQTNQTEYDKAEGSEVI